MTNPSHSLEHSDINDAMAAVQSKVGVNGSAVTTTLDYLIYGHGLGVFNVKDPRYGATGNGTTDDTAAIQAAINAAAAANGVCYFPPGTYICNDATTPASSSDYIIIRGAGKYATTLLANSATDAVLTQQCAGLVMDMTVDGGGVATNGLKQAVNATTYPITEMGAIRVRTRNISSSSAGWVHVIWDTSSAFGISRAYLEDVLWEGPSSTSSDAAAVSYVDTCYVSNLTCSDLHRTPNFYAVNILVAKGIKVASGSTGSTAAFVIDQYVADAFVEGLTYEDGGANLDVWINAARVRAVGWKVPNYGSAGVIGLNNSAIAQVAEFIGCDLLSGVSIVNEMTALRFSGGSIQYGPAGGPIRCDVTSGPVTVDGTAIICGGGYDSLFYAASGSASHQAAVTGGTASGLTAFNNQGSIVTGSFIRGVQGYNPVGSVTVAVPASGTAVAAAPYDRTFYVTNGSASSTFAISGGPTITLPASAVLAIRVPAGETLTPTYTTAPTWVVEGE